MPLIHALTPPHTHIPLPPPVACLLLANFFLMTCLLNDQRRLRQKYVNVNRTACQLIGTSGAPPGHARLKHHRRLWAAAHAGSGDLQPARLQADAAGRLIQQPPAVAAQVITWVSPEHALRQQGGVERRRGMRWAAQRKAAQLGTDATDGAGAMLLCKQQLQPLRPRPAPGAAWARPAAGKAHPPAAGSQLPTAARVSGACAPSAALSGTHGRGCPAGRPTAAPPPQIACGRDGAGGVRAARVQSKVWRADNVRQWKIRTQGGPEAALPHTQVQAGCARPSKLA